MALKLSKKSFKFPVNAITSYNSENPIGDTSFLSINTTHQHKQIIPANRKYYITDNRAIFDTKMMHTKSRALKALNKQLLFIPVT